MRNAMRDPRSVDTTVAFAIALAALVLFSPPRSLAAAEGEAVLAIRAPRVHTGAGETIENATILIRGGRIEAIGADVAVPDGATIIEGAGLAVTPGLIDANALIEPRDAIDAAPVRGRRVQEFFGIAGIAPGAPRAAGADAKGGADPAAGARPPYQAHCLEELWHDDAVVCPVCGGHGDADDHGLAAGVITRSTTEHAAEIVPHTRLLDSLDLRSPDFERLLRGGVTTVYASPDGAAVVGPRGAILRTFGPPEDRVVAAAAAVKGTIGSDPFRVGAFNRTPSRFSGGSSIYTRRPTTRMGVTWVFRKAFYDTVARARGWPVGGADTPSVDASRVLAQVIDGSVPLRIQARLQHDIETALRLTAELGLEFMLEDGAEAYRVADLLAARGVPVVFGPIDDTARGQRRLSSDNLDRSRLSTFTALLAAGVDTALSAQDLREEDGLARQAMAAVRFGASPEDALRAVTSTPARLLGIHGDTGSIQPGKRADLVVWTGAPFAADSRIALVIAGGAIAFDGRTP